MNEPSYQTCPAQGCKVAIPWHTKLCKKHWHMVGGRLQGELDRNTKGAVGDCIDLISRMEQR